MHDNEERPQLQVKFHPKNEQFALYIQEQTPVFDCKLRPDETLDEKTSEGHPLLRGEFIWPAGVKAPLE